MKLNCKNCDCDVTPYVTPYKANWKAECPICNSDLGTIKDQQPDDDEYLAWALARRQPRNLKERLWLIARKLLPMGN